MRLDGKFNKKIYEVRTRKILLYSNLLASVSNLIVVGIGVAAGAASENPEVIKKTLRYLDVGGLIVTIGRLFSDLRFITKVKDEFINMVKTYYPNCYSTAYKISKVIQKNLDIDVDDSEIVYLALHIYHFQSQNNTQNE